VYITPVQVGIAPARDRDLPPHNEFTYFLDRRYDTFRLFDLDKVSGVISTREVLDRERQSMYNLVVVARSNNRPHLSSTAHVQIEVILLSLLPRPRGFHRAVAPIGGLEIFQIQFSMQCKLRLKYKSGTKIIKSVATVIFSLRLRWS